MQTVLLCHLMSPQADPTEDDFPFSGLQARGVVQDDEFRDPQHRDIHNEKCLIVVKNGAATETTLGRVNGLESFIRRYDDRGTPLTSIEFAVFHYGKEFGKFSDAGDSGSIVLARDGKIVGLLTGGAGRVDGPADITYITPYWWLEKKIKAKFPDCFLYDSDVV